ncbi:MAG: hypothetical protein LJE56_07110 [Acidiferrobacterales bacterium]|jgi:hypothetical protein|nr:hypothetical protein [Acidiferrobacterales bacterium]
MNEKNTDTDRQNQDLARLDGALDAIARVMKETELMLDEEPKTTAREALQNIITLLESASLEYQKRRKTVVYELREAGFEVEF